MNTAFPFQRPLYVMPKPAGAHCNLACDYCYYLEKLNLYPKGVQHVMTDELTEIYIREYIQSQFTPEVNFTWHGGEPLMRPISYYRKVIRWQKEYAAGRHIVNCLQTNGTLLTPEWAKFLHDEGWLVGISIDGPQHMHDAYRRKRGGAPTWQKVMQGIELLDRFDVEWNAMAVVNDVTAEDPLGFYRFFRDELVCQYLQFTPVVERILKHEDGRHLANLLERTEGALNGQSPLNASKTHETGAQAPFVAPFSVTPEKWGEFLCKIFDEWVRNDVGEMFVQIFDATLANWMGETPGVCSLSNWCGHASVMEYNGDIYSCDHFVFPEYKLGNIRNRSILDMMDSPEQKAFAELKTKGLPRQCKQCQWQFACHGECPRNRFMKTSDGEAGLNYLCPGYHRFFSHVAPYMDFMKGELEANRAPANVMQWTPS